MLEVKQINPLRIFHVVAPTQYDLCITFVRLQEFYESPNEKFRGNVFTLEQYMDWYSKTYGNGVFTYTNDWRGFNIPGHVVTSFFRLLSRRRRCRRSRAYQHFREKEHELADKLYAKFGINVFPFLRNKKEEPYYLIGTTKNIESHILDHEVRHAWFYLVEEYREIIERLVNHFKLKSLRKTLYKIGYNESVIVDEIQAYVLTGLRKEMKETTEIKTLRNSLKKVENWMIKEKIPNMEKKT